MEANNPQLEANNPQLEANNPQLEANNPQLEANNNSPFAQPPLTITMKFTRIASTFLLSLGLLTGISQGQGGLEIGKSVDDFGEEDFPLTWTAMANLGYDSNINSLDLLEEESVYLQAGIGTEWAGGSQTTRYTLGTSASLLYYFDDVEVNDDESWYYSGRVQGSMVHRASSQLTVSDSLYATYEYEPDRMIGASVTRRTDQYFYFHNNAALSYAFDSRFSGVANWVFSSIIYDGDDVEDRYTSRLGLQGRYHWQKATSLVGEYRFVFTEYDNEVLDYTSHYLLAGADHLFSAHTRGSLRAGAEFRDYDRFSSDTLPYFEASLIRQIKKDLSIRGVLRYGLEDSELGTFERRESTRAVVAARFEIGPRTEAEAGLSYVHGELKDSRVGLSDGDEDFVGINLGLSHLWGSNKRIQGGYSFGMMDSDFAFRDFDRHRLWFGVSATF